MPNFVDVTYAQTGNSLGTDALGMREMQAKAFAARDSQYLLLKAPPASGKSRALMFLALDKLHNHGVKKVIVAVPEMSIGASFAATDLTTYGFYWDWEFNPSYNLCTSEGESRKVQAFQRFMADPDEQIIICTHATLRFAFEKVDVSVFNDTLLAIDEFHHVSSDENSILGEVLRSLMAKTNAHIIAMTGTYFRGDSVPVMEPADYAKFEKVTYNYYEQLDGYKHLKSLGIGYHFYQSGGRGYLDAIDEVLDTDKKTIVHIPSPNSAAAVMDKNEEVGHILDLIGDVERQDHQTGIMYVKRHKDGKVLKVADLVNDDPNQRPKVSNYLSKMEDLNDMDLIIALGMAKEGFDWPYCEHALTVGYRGSLTEVIQIIGRATRDSSNKTRSQFTNLIAQPDAADAEVTASVNNMLKAIAASLLMEQVLAPNFKFKAKRPGDDKQEPGTVKIHGYKEPSTDRVREIVETDITDLKAKVLQDPTILKAMADPKMDPKVVNQVLVPKAIRKIYPECSENEIEEIRQHVIVDSVVKNGDITQQGDKRFVRMADKFINIEELNIDLIDSVNPFLGAFEVLSKALNSGSLKVIQEAIHASKIDMSDEEAVILYREGIPEFMELHNGRVPDIGSNDPHEKRLAEALAHLRTLRRRRAAGTAG